MYIYHNIKVSGHNKPLSRKESRQFYLKNLRVRVCIPDS